MAQNCLPKTKLGLLMSGKRQHYVPRFLQEGFASHRSGEKSFTWVYRRATEPFNTNIINVGVEGQFYSIDGDSIADDVLTALEGQFGAIVSDLRLGSAESLRTENLADLIVHLEIRSRHLRESFLNTGEWLVARLLDFVADEEAYAAYLTRKLQRDPAIFRESMVEGLTKQGVPEAYWAPLIEAVTPHLPAFIQHQKVNFSAFANQIRAGMPAALRAAAKSGHIKVLKNSPIPQPRLQRFKDFKFIVARIPEDDLILGDSIVVFEVAAPKRLFKPVVDADDGIGAVYLPLDRGQVLIGCRENFNVDLSMLRQGIACCSLEYFIAPEKTAVNAQLHAQIGIDAILITQEELENILDEVLHE